MWRGNGWVEGKTVRGKRENKEWKGLSGEGNSSEMW